MPDPTMMSGHHPPLGDDESARDHEDRSPRSVSNGRRRAEPVLAAARVGEDPSLPESVTQRACGRNAPVHDAKRILASRLRPHP
jgi:hypothetical protein